MRARRTPTLAELPDIESRSRRDRRPVRRARRSKSKSWSIRQVSDERIASAAWANRTTFGRPTTAWAGNVRSQAARAAPPASPSPPSPQRRRWSRRQCPRLLCYDAPVPRRTPTGLPGPSARTRPSSWRCPWPSPPEAGLGSRFPPAPAGASDRRGRIPLVRTEHSLLPQGDLVVALRQSGLPFCRPPATGLLGPDRTFTGKSTTAFRTHPLAACPGGTCTHWLIGPLSGHTLLPSYSLRCGWLIAPLQPRGRDLLQHPRLAVTRRRRRPRRQ
jgi:hypothetical protein